MKKYFVWYDNNGFDAEIFANDEYEANDMANTIIAETYGFCDNDFLHIEEVE